MAIALFYSVGTGIAALSPSLFGALIATPARSQRQASPFARSVGNG